MAAAWQPSMAKAAGKQRRCENGGLKACHQRRNNYQRHNGGISVAS